MDEVEEEGDMARFEWGEDQAEPRRSLAATEFRETGAPMSERRPRSQREAATGPMTPVRAAPAARRREGDSMAFGRAAIHCFSHLARLDASGDTRAAAGPSAERVVAINRASLVAGPVPTEEGSHLEVDAGFTLSKLGAGGCLCWTKRFDGSVRVEGIAIDARGEIVLTGVFLGPMKLGGPTLQSVGADAFVAKLDALGNHRWSVRFGDSYCQGKGVVVGGWRDIFVTGVFFGTADLGAGPIAARSAPSMFVARLDGEGRAVWTRCFGGVSLTMGLGISVKAPNRLFVSGICDGTVDFGGGPILARDGTAIVSLELDTAGNHRMSRRIGLLQTRLHD
jgi:hypothetical protein